MSPSRAESDPDAVDLEIRCEADSRVLGPLRTVASALAGERGFSEEEIEQIEMAVDEACANAVRHAYKHRGADHAAGRMLGVRVRIGEEMLRFQVIDEGIGVRNAPPGASSVEEYIERGGRSGLGIHIIRTFMDEVSFDCLTECGGTVLTMTKYLRREGAEA